MNPHWYSASPEIQRRLISLFIQSLTARSPLSTLPSFDSEINSTKSPHDIAAVLRWGLRHLQLQGNTFGHKEDWYKTFFDAEREAEYPQKAFSDKLTPLIPSEHMALLKEVLEVFSSLAAHGEGNSTSGSKLSKIFGLWLLNTHRVETKDDWKSFYDRWEVAGRQLEHIFFARIRDEAVEKRIPTRLVDLVRKYPFYRDNASPTTDLRLLPRSPLSTRIYDALLVRVETEVPNDRSRPKSRIHPIRIIADALSSEPGGGELSSLWSTISEASKSEGSGTPLSKILSDETVSLLSLLPDEDGSNDQKSPTYSLLPLSAASPRMKRNSFSLSEFTEDLKRTHSTQSTASPHSPISADWSLFSSTGFGASPTLTPLSSALFSPDLERTSPPSRRPSRHGKESSTASTAPRKSVDFAPGVFPSTIAEEQRVSSTSKIASLQVVQLDESFIDFWSDALLDPLSSNWPSFVVCRLHSDVVPNLKYGPAEEGRPEKTLQWLVVEQQITVKPPPVPVTTSAPAPEEPVEAPPERPSSPQSIGKKRFSFWTSSRSTSSNSITSTKSKRKDLLKGQRVGEMGEVIEEGEAAGGSSGTRSRRRTKVEDVVRVRIPSPKPRKSGDVRSLQSVDVGSPTVAKMPVPAKVEETKEGENGSPDAGAISGNVVAAAGATVAAAGAAVVVGTAAPALAAAASVIAVPVAAVIAVAALANANTEGENEGEPQPADRKEEEEGKAVEGGPEEVKEETVVVVLDDKVSDPEAGEPKPVVPEEVVVVPAAAIAEDATFGHIDESTNAEASVEKQQEEVPDEDVPVVEGEVEEVPAVIQSPSDPEPVAERTIPVEQVAVPVIEDDAVIGSIPAVVEEVAEDVYVDSIPAIAPAPADEAEVATAEVVTPLAEDEIKSKEVEVAGEPAVPGMPVQEFEPAAEEAVGAASLDVAPAPLAEVEDETDERIKENAHNHAANGYHADVAEEKASPEPEAPLAIEQSVINHEMSAPVPEPELLPVQEEDVASAPEAVVAAVGEQPAPVNTIVGNGALKEELTQIEPEVAVPFVEETADHEPVEEVAGTTAPLDIPVPDQLAHDLPTDSPETTALSTDESKPEATTDTIVESHLNAEHRIPALDNGLQGTTASTVSLGAETEAENPETSTLTPREATAEPGPPTLADNKASNAPSTATQADEQGIEEELEEGAHTRDSDASGGGAALLSEVAVVPEDEVNKHVVVEAALAEADPTKDVNPAETHIDLEKLTPPQAPESTNATQPAESDAPVSDVKSDDPFLFQQETPHENALEHRSAVDPVDASLTNTIVEAAPTLPVDEVDQDMDRAGSATEVVNIISSIPHIERLKADDDNDTSTEGVDLPAVPLVDAEFKQPSDVSEHIIVPFSEEKLEHHEQDETASLSETLEAQHLPPAIEHALEVGSTPSVEALLDAVQSAESAHEDDVATKPTPPSIDVGLAETFAGADDLPTAIETAFDTGLASNPEALLNAVQATLSATVFASGAPSLSEEKKEDSVRPFASTRALDDPEHEESLESGAKDRSLEPPAVREAPMLEERSPVVELVTPAVEEAPAVEQTSVEETVPIVEQGDRGDALGAKEESAPDEDDAVPVEEASEVIEDGMRAEQEAPLSNARDDSTDVQGIATILERKDALSLAEPDVPAAAQVTPAAPIIEVQDPEPAPVPAEDPPTDATPPAESKKPDLTHGVEDQPIATEFVSAAVEEESPVVEEEQVVVETKTPDIQEDTLVAEEDTLVVGEDEHAEEEKPVVEQDTPIYDEQAPIVVEEDVPPSEESLVEEETRGALEEETSVVEAEVPIVEEGKPVVEDEKPIVEDEKPIVVDESPVNDAEPAIVEGGAPVADEEEQPVVEDAKPIDEEVVGGTQLGEEEKHDVEEEQVAVAEGTPVVEEEKPEEEQQPIVEEEAPVVEEQSPVVEEKPEDEQEVPIVDRDIPVVEEEVPIVEEIKVAKDEAPVVEEQSTLTEPEEGQPIVEEDPPLVEKDTPVVEEEAPVAEGVADAPEDAPAVEKDVPVAEAEKPICDEEGPHNEDEAPADETEDAPVSAPHAAAEKESFPLIEAEEHATPLEHAPLGGDADLEDSPAVDEATVLEAATAQPSDASQSRPTGDEAATPGETVSAAIDKLSIPIVEDDDPSEEVDLLKPAVPDAEEATNTPNVVGDTP